MTDEDTRVTDPTCVVCREAPAMLGVLCQGCSAEITAPIGLLPQQILGTCARPTGAALVDQWGRPHALEDRMLVGRASEGAGLLVLEASVSRHHAHLALDHGGWRVRDLASVNGTFVNDALVDASALVHGDRVAFGLVRFYLALDIGLISAVAVDGAAITTIRTIPRSAAARDGVFDDADLDAPVLIDEEVTDPGLPIADLRIAETAGGGGGVLQVGTISTPLSTNQTRLVALLAERMVSESHQPPFVRGFVRSSELLGSLTWDSPDPDDNHVKQLVRRTRRQLVRAGLGDLIEARQRFGYRLRVIPIVPTP